jgi:hypothetical protein
LCKIVFLGLSIVPVVKIQRFGSWIRTSSSGKNKGEEDRKYLLGPLVEIPSDLVGVCG